MIMYTNALHTGKLITRNNPESPLMETGWVLMTVHVAEEIESPPFLSTTKLTFIA